MLDSRSTTQRILQFKDRDRKAEVELHDQFFNLMVRYAKRMFGQLGLRPGSFKHDEEVVYNSVFRHLIEARDKDGLQGVDSGDDLRAFLYTSIKRKVIDAWRYAQADKRRLDLERGESAIGPQDAEEDQRRPIENVAGHAPGPESVVVGKEVEERLVVSQNKRRDRLLDALPEKRLQDVANLHLDGGNNSRIAETLGIRRHTVADRLKRIYDIWSSHGLLEDCLRLAELANVRGPLREIAKLLDEVASGVRKDIEELLTSLGEKGETVVRLCILGDSKEQIAKKLKIDENVVEVILDHARTVLAGEARDG